MKEIPGMESIKPVGGKVEEPDSTDISLSGLKSEQIVKIIGNRNLDIVDRYAAALQLKERGGVEISNEEESENGRIFSFDITIGEKSYHIE